MDFEAGIPAEPSPPLEGVGRVYEAFARSLEEVPGTDGPVAVEIPEEFRPLPLDEGLQALREQTQELCRLGFALRNSLADLLYASIGTELGEYHRTGEARPNPELAGKLRETSHALQGCLALSVQAAWLLRHYRCLPEFLKLAVTPTADLHPDWRPPELGQPVPLTDPGLPAELGIPPLSRPLGDMARQLGRTRGRRNRRRRISLSLPESLHPRPYAEGMRLVWDHAAKATRAAAALAPALAALCQTIVRTELGEAARTGSVAPAPELPPLVRAAGTTACLLLEEGWNIAGCLCSQPTLDELVTGPRPHG